MKYILANYDKHKKYLCQTLLNKHNSTETTAVIATQY